MNDFKQLLSTVEQNKNNPVVLSEIAIQLASLLYTHNEEMAKAQLSEAEAFIEALHEEGEKKMTVAEAEAQSIVRTANLYKVYRGQGEAVLEVINTIKKRVDLLVNESKLNQ